MAERRRLRVGALVVALGVLWLGTGTAQQAPLRKTDLVRLLTNPSMTKAQVADRVKAACLAFDPTGRDRVDLATLGADQAVMAAINECVRKKTAAAAPAAAPPAGRQPAPQRPPAAQPAARPPAAAPARPQVAAAPPPAVTTRPGPPAVTEVQPSRLDVRPGQPAGRRQVIVTVRDARGTPVPGERVEFRPLTAGLGIPAFGGVTDRSGQLSVAFVTTALKGNGTIGVFVRGAQQATLGVLVEPVVLSQQRTRFVTGEGQRGVVGQALGLPLVLEVRDTSGAPVTGETVALTAVNGTVSPASAPTDARGQVSATVTAGRQAGKTVITASVGTLRRETTVNVAPGPARTLVLLRDTLPLGATLSLSSTKPVLLRVMARDTFGNQVAVTGVRATARNPQVLRIARADTLEGAGRVELRAQTSGSTQLEVEAAGVRQAVPAEVLLPVAGGSGGVIAFRAGWTGFSYHFLNLALRGRGGPFAEVNFGWTLVPGVRVTTGVSFARVALDTGTVSAPTTLMDGSLRLEFSPLPRGSIRPVVALGGGQYQTRAPDLNGLGRHTSQFWLAGAGLDFPLRDKMIVELRAMTHQLHQSKTQFADAGSVGSLTTITLGFRFGS